MIDGKIMESFMAPTDSPVVLLEGTKTRIVNCKYDLFMRVLNFENCLYATIRNMKLNRNM